MHIVALETVFTPLPADLGLPVDRFTLTTYARSTPADLPARLATADVAVLTTVPLSAALLDAAVTPRLRLVVALASGTDTIDGAACRARGIRVVNCPGSNRDAVAEHALALYFAARRRLLPAMRALRAGAWPAAGTLLATAETPAAGAPRACAAETAVLVGYGGVGQRVGVLLKALGMTVVVAGRKGDPTPPADRVPFAAALAAATVLVLCCPRTPDTLNLLSTPEFAALRPDCVLVNVARGGVVDEAALLAALQAGRLGGAGVDVYDGEPASAATSPLLGDAADALNLVTTPHTAWVGAATTANYQRQLVAHLRAFAQGGELGGVVV